jgi:hypothetical protein
MDLKCGTSGWYLLVLVLCRLVFVLVCVVLLRDFDWKLLVDHCRTWQVFTAAKIFKVWSAEMFENFNYKVLWLYHVFMSFLVVCCPVSTKLCFYKKINRLSFGVSLNAHVTVFITGNIAVHISFHEPCTPCMLLGKELGTVRQVSNYERILLLGVKSHVVAVVVNEACL